MALANAQRPAFAPHRPSHRGLDRIAVILNKNAKRVTPRVRREIESIAPPHADVFFTESIEQADFVIRRVIDSGYGKIVTGGGDGTVLNTIDKALAHIDARGYTDCPEFAVLKLGTGNAIADFLGAGDVTHDLSRRTWQTSVPNGRPVVIRASAPVNCSGRVSTPPSWGRRGATIAPTWRGSSR